MHLPGSARILTATFLTMALAGSPMLAQQPAPTADHHAHHIIKTDSEHTPEGEPLHKHASVGFTNCTPEEEAFFNAAWTADLAGVKAAVEKNPAIVHSHGDWAMSLAAEGDSLAVVRYLAEHGGDLTVEDNKPLTSAAGNGNLPLFDYVASHIAAVPQESKDVLMVISCYGDNLDMVKRIQALGPNLRYRSGHGDTPASAAAKHGAIEILTYVVDELHADIHDKDEDALRQAASHNRADSVSYLLARDANVHAKHDEALRLAVEGGDFDQQGGKVGYPEVVRILLKHGANPFAVSRAKLAETEKKYPAVADMLKKRMDEIKAQGAPRLLPAAF